MIKDGDIYADAITELEYEVVSSNYELQFPDGAACVVILSRKFLPSGYEVFTTEYFNKNFVLLKKTEVGKRQTIYMEISDNEIRDEFYRRVKEGCYNE